MRNIGPNWDGNQFWFESILGHEYIFEVYSLDPEYTGDYTLELYEFVDDNFDGLPDYMGQNYIADGLGGTGIFLDNGDGTAGITVTGTSVYRNRLENNGGDGLFLLSSGAVIVNYMDSLENGGMGLNLNTNIHDDWTPPAAVTLTGLNLDGNGNHGLGVRTLGSIAWTNSRSTGNLGYASDLDNCQYDDFSFGGHAGQLIAKPITLTRLVSDGNMSVEFVANSFGSITASGIISHNSGGSGMYLNNAYTGSTGSITLLGTLGENQFMNNWFAGLRVYSNGNVTLNNIRAEWNGEGNSEAGVRVYSHGTILISKGIIENNYNDGIYAVESITT